MTEVPKLDTEKINEAIADRSGVFYWQTDRKVEPEQAGLIWADRHRYFTDAELVEAVNTSLGDDKLVRIEPLDLEAQTNLGNVNSVRVGTLESGKQVIIRCHPKHIKNGYFHAESAASQKALETGVPSYQTLGVHDYEGGDDFAFQVIEKLPGTAITKWLPEHPEDEGHLLFEAGKTMAGIHRVEVDGFGPFDNEKAKGGKLEGVHGTLEQSVRAGLDFNLGVLQKFDVLTADQAAAIDQLFTHNPLLVDAKAVLVHNDFADWNLLTDGQTITGVLDWDECVASDPVSDIACWSTFFDPERLTGFLEGYFSVAEKPDNFEEKFELMRLRYVVSKMTLRLRRYSWEPSDAMKQRIEAGKQHLAESIRFFGL